MTVVPKKSKYLRIIGNDIMTVELVTSQEFQKSEF